MTEASSVRSSFGRTVVPGLAAAGLLTWAAHRPFARLEGQEAAMAEAVLGTAGGEVPVAGAFALVLLAAWGVLLVTRGRLRRVVAGVAFLAALVGLIAVVTGIWVAPEQLSDRVSGQGYAVEVVRTGWVWLAVVAALVSLALTAVAVLRCRDWPEMGAAYDAPGTSATSTSPMAGDNRDIWKALDEGRDPTQGG